MDNHICFHLDFDLQESYPQQQILDSEGRDLLNLFDQQTVYLYNKDATGEQVVDSKPQQIAVVSKKGRKRASVFLFDKSLNDKDEETINIPNNKPQRRSKFFLFEQGYPNPAPGTNSNANDQNTESTQVILNFTSMDAAKKKADPSLEIRTKEAATWKLVRDAMPEKLKNLVKYCETLKKDSSKKVCLILDDTMLHRSYRRRYMNMAKESGWGFQEVLVKATVAEAMKYDTKRGAHKQVGTGVITSSLEQLDIVPNKHLMVWDKYDKKLETFEDNIKVPVDQVILDENVKAKMIKSFELIMNDCMDTGVTDSISFILKGDNVMKYATGSMTNFSFLNDKKVLSKTLMGEKKLFVELLKNLTEKLFEIEKQMGSMNLYKTCQEVVMGPNSPLKRPKCGQITSVENFDMLPESNDSFFKDRLTMNAEETDIDYEYFMEIIGDIEEIVEHQGQKCLDNETKQNLIGKCNTFFGKWAILRLTRQTN